ncbi:MAG: peptidylprolyl isomerase [Bacteroidetes bacterium]|nr:peptidylprolyl isomerase [Bacteroidota bacterium]
MNRLLILLFACSFVFASCGKEQLEKDVTKIQKYLDDKGLNAQSTDSGLHYIIEDEGTGTEHPTASSDVTVYYTGSFLDGSYFDASNGTPVTFNLQNVIQGWREGIPLFKKGGKGKLFIPSDLGYGPNDYGPIPGKSILIFDIELEDFE